MLLVFVPSIVTVPLFRWFLPIGGGYAFTVNCISVYFGTNYHAIQSDKRDVS